VDHHVTRLTRLDPAVLISESWYKPFLSVALLSGVFKLSNLRAGQLPAPTFHNGKGI
jgi:hypothetical protein